MSSITEIELYTQADQIVQPGKYRISHNPNEIDPKTGYSRERNWPYDEFIPGNPSTMVVSLAAFLNESFSGKIQQVKFTPRRRSFDGSISSAISEYQAVTLDPNARERQLYLVVNEAECFLTLGTKNNGDPTSSSIFSIMDKKFIVDKNQLVAVDSPYHNGRYILSTIGVETYQDRASQFTGIVDFAGDKPSPLIAACWEFTKQFVKKPNYPVWLKTGSRRSVYYSTNKPNLPNHL